jgi:uncharacterized protein YqeY
MNLDHDLLEDMKRSMKSGDKLRVETVRGLRAQLKNARISKGEELSDEDMIQVLSSAAKKRKESIEQFKAVGRPDRADTEQTELDIIYEYLPKQLDENQIRQLLDSIVAEVKPSSMADMGRIMGIIMPKVKGQAEGKLVQQIVRDKLSSL